MRDKLKNLPWVISHIDRVRKLAVFIAEQEHADKEMVEIAALLHDIGYATDFSDHKKYSVAIAREFIKGYDIPNSELLLNAIEHGKEPKSLEAEIILDADALEIIGPSGVIRLTISFFHDHHILNQKDIVPKVEELMASRIKGLRTATARKLAQWDTKQLTQFFDTVKSQMECDPKKLLRT